MIFRRKVNFTRLIENLSSSFDIVLNGLSAHTLRVAFIAVLISYELDFHKRNRTLLYLSSLLHDIGVSESESSILFEIENRNSDKLQHHALVGYEVLKMIPLFEDIALVVKDHHNIDTNNIISKIIYFSDEIDVLLKKESFYTTTRLNRKVYLLYKDKPSFREILDAFLKISKNDYFLITLSNVNEIKRYFNSHVEENIISLSIYDFSQIAKSLAETFIDKKSNFTLTHSRDVAVVSSAIAKKIGLSEKNYKTIEIAGFLHDIGKLFVPVNVLEYHGKLNEKDWLTMKSHAYYTYSFLKQIDLDEEIIHIASSHHEFLDGSGYPFGLDKSNLSIGAQILTVADIYSALRQERPYRKYAHTHEESIDILLEMANKGKVNKKLVKAMPKGIL